MKAMHGMVNFDIAGLERADALASRRSAGLHQDCGGAEI
jgi:hypothetical protein